MKTCHLYVRKQEVNENPILGPISDPKGSPHSESHTFVQTNGRTQAFSLPAATDEARNARPSQAEIEVQYTTFFFHRAIRPDGKSTTLNAGRQTVCDARIRRRNRVEAALVICGHRTGDVTQVYAERNLELDKKMARELV